MSDTITVEVRGLKELSQAMQQLPQKLRGKVLGHSVKAPAELIRDQARANARAIFKVPTGATEQSIVAWAKPGNTSDNITYLIGVTLKKKFPRRRKKAASGVMGRHGKQTVAGGSWSSSGPYWWRYREFGTIKEAAMPYLRPAWDHRSSDALILMKGMLTQAVVIAVRGLPKYTGG